MGSSSRLTALFDKARRQVVAFFGRSPRIAYPATGIFALAVCGLLVWLLAFQGGSEGAGEVKGESTSPTPATTTATVTTTPAATGSPVETVVAAGVTPGATASSSSGGSSNQGPAAESGMRFKIPSIGVDAPVTIRTVGSDGQMGVPNGRFDVVWYDFSAWPGLGGYPGDGGNAVFAGHVDYHPNYEAVFWDLHLVGAGDIIEVDLSNGNAVRYSVTSSESINPDADFSAYVSNTGEDTITIVTCQGTFNSATHQYDHRLVVRGTRIS
jgi:LPXTG-site transpeptidase (sortase) family protein